MLRGEGRMRGSTGGRRDLEPILRIPVKFQADSPISSSNHLYSVEDLGGSVCGVHLIECFQGGHTGRGALYVRVVDHDITEHFGRVQHFVPSISTCEEHRGRLMRRHRVIQCALADRAGGSSKGRQEYSKQRIEAHNKCRNTE